MLILQLILVIHYIGHYTTSNKSLATSDANFMSIHHWLIKKSLGITLFVETKKRCTGEWNLRSTYHSGNDTVKNFTWKYICCLDFTWMWVLLQRWKISKTWINQSTLDVKYSAFECFIIIQIEDIKIALRNTNYFLMMCMWR